MNYLKEILNFEKLQELNQVSPGQARLWYVLMYVNNLAGWKDWFTVASSTLEFRSGLSRQGVIKSRDRLKQLGYIDFKTNGRKATAYHMNPLMPSQYQDGLQDSVQGGLQAGVQDSVQTSLQVGVQGSVQTSVQDGGVLNKQNKTKLNETKTSTPLTPQRGEVEQADPDAKIEPEEKPKQTEPKKPKKDDPKFSEQAAKIIDHLNQKTGAHYKASTPKTKELIKARMNEGFTVDDFLKVIDNKVAEWGNDGKMRNYLRPVTLFAPSKFESYLNQQPKRSRWGDPNAWKQPERRYYYNT